MFSIIVSIYKVEQYLPQCIESILGQTFTDFELILIDDGSPDACPEICDAYAQKDSRIKVIHKNNEGLMSTRKLGASVAKGNYLCFVDGDDFVQNDMLGVYAKVLSKQKPDIISCGYSTYSQEKTEAFHQKIPVGYYDKEKLLKLYSHMLSVAPFFSFYIMPSVWSKCIKKEIAQKVYADIPNEISLGEDVAAVYPILLCAESLTVIDYYGYMYRQNHSSMTHTYDENLYTKVKRLVLHLREQAKRYQWDGTQQIDEYTWFLLYIAKTNELAYNHCDTYSVKKNKFMEYLRDETFACPIQSLRIKGLKNKILLWCFKRKIVFPLYVFSKIK